MRELKEKKGFICDMDGVIYHGNRILPGVKEFVEWLKANDKKFLFLTNNGGKTPKDLQEKLRKMGLEVEETCFYTSGLATAAFIKSQKEDARAYVIGEEGLANVLRDQGIEIDDNDVDYVVVGEVANYNYDTVCKAVQLVLAGAKLIGTNSDLTGPTENGIAPACRALISPIEMATGKQAYFVGKPNPLMMRTGLDMLGVHSKDAAIIGDRMDTDIIAGIESGLDTVLVLSGVSTRETVEFFPYRPRLILEGVGKIADL